jgi:hypothetical protein
LGGQSRSIFGNFLDNKVALNDENYYLCNNEKYYLAAEAGWLVM